MLTLAQPRAMRSWNCSADSPVPPCSAIGTPVASTRSVTRWWSSTGAAVYWPWALPIAGAKQSTPVRCDEVDRHLEALLGRRLVGADAVLDALDALDLALDVGAAGARLGDDLGGLPQVLGDVELVGVEQHGVPAALQAVAR